MAAAAVVAIAASGAALAQDLVVGLAGNVTSIDPHFYNAAPNNSVNTHFFDRLINRTPEAKLEPWLALSWKIGRAHV